MGLKNFTYPYMGVEGCVKYFQNHPYVINEWRLKELVINRKNLTDSAQDGEYWRFPVCVTFILRVPKAMKLVIIALKQSI